MEAIEQIIEALSLTCTLWLPYIFDIREQTTCTQGQRTLAAWEQSHPHIA